jgi:hypothetical protein
VENREAGTAQAEGGSALAAAAGFVDTAVQAELALRLSRKPAIPPHLSVTTGIMGKWPY